jgi:CheY-like chemotaxis protein
MATPRQRRVLVVEDDPKIARLIGDYLVREGFEARALADCREALAELERALLVNASLRCMESGIGSRCLEHHAVSSVARGGATRSVRG